MQEKTTQEEVKKEPIIGDFTPKRKYLNFVSAVNGHRLVGARVRFIRDVAFLKGEKLSGMLEGVIFKITICDEGTIKFEESDTKVSNQQQIQRLIDDIDSMDVTGYANKYVISGLEFNDVDGRLCYLEVDYKKPIDKLKSIFEDEKPELTERGFSILDSLFSDDKEVEFDEDHALDLVLNDIVSDLSEKDLEVISESIKNPKEPNEVLKGAAQSYMEEQFRKMNEDKVNELKKRIENGEKESEKLRSEISMNETKLKKQLEELKVLESRLDSFNSNDELTGYVFFVSEEQKPEDIGLTQENRLMADKIADIVGLKKDILFKLLTEGHYNIHIAEKSDLESKEVKVNQNILDKLKSLVNGDESPDAKITMIESGKFEYRGSLTWHQIVGKMIRKGFEQNEEFDKFCNSNSYESKEVQQEETKVEKKKSKKK